jgi:hypothetical protein
LWGREAFIARLWEALDANGVLLVAPRRFGKTSVMHALCDAQREPWTAVYLDAEHVRHPAEFAVALIRKCWEAAPSWRTALAERFEQAKGWFGAAVSAVGLASSPDQHFWFELRRDMNRAWESRSLELLQALRTIEARVVFAVDELAVLLENFADRGAERPLGDLRSPRTRSTQPGWLPPDARGPGDGLLHPRRPGDRRVRVLVEHPA